MTKYADDAMLKAQHITQLIKDTPDKYELVNKPMGTNVCFWYTPPAFRGRDYSYDQKCQVHKIIFDRMMAKGSLMIQHNPLEEHNLPNFFRLVLKNE